MAFKILAGIVAATLLLAFLVPYVLKMREIELGVVIAAGLAMMARDLWESLREKDD